MASLRRVCACNVLAIALAICSLQQAVGLRVSQGAPLDDHASIRILNQLTAPLAVQCEDSIGRRVDVGVVPVNDVGKLLFTLYQQSYWKCALGAPALGLRGYFTLWTSSPSFNTGANPLFLATKDGLYLDRPGAGAQDGMLLYHWQ